MSRHAASGLARKTVRAGWDRADGGQLPESSFGPVAGLEHRHLAQDVVDDPRQITDAMRLWVRQNSAQFARQGMLHRNIHGVAFARLGRTTRQQSFECGKIDGFGRHGCVSGRARAALRARILNGTLRHLA